MKATTTSLLTVFVLTITMPGAATAGQVTPKVTVPHVNAHINTQSSGGGGGTGKVTITKQMDKSSPLLFQRAVTGSSGTNKIGSFTSGGGGGGAGK